jgi:uridine kinase
MFVLGIGGGSGSGKTFLAEKITENTQKNTQIVPLDRYYRPFNNLTDQERKQVDFDSPETIDWELLRNHVRKLKTGKTVKMPKYSFEKNTRTGIEEIEPAQVIIIEGIHAFYDNRINEIMDFKVFLDVDADIRATQRMKRDVKNRNRDPEFAAAQYIEKTRNAHQKHVEPTKNKADKLLQRNEIQKFAENFSKQISNLKTAETL